MTLMTLKAHHVILLIMCITVFVLVVLPDSAKETFDTPADLEATFSKFLDFVCETNVIQRVGSGWWAFHPFAFWPDIKYYVNGTEDAKTFKDSPARKVADMKTLRDGLVSGSIPWKDFGTAWNTYTSFLLSFMSNGDANTFKTFAALITDYCANNKRLVNPNVTYDAKWYSINAPGYSRNASWVLGQAGTVGGLVDILGGFIKTYDKAPYGDKKVLMEMMTNKMFLKPTPRLSDAKKATIPFTPAQFKSIRTGLLVDHTRYFIMRYKYTGAVPNQRAAGLDTLTRIGYLFKGFCDDDTTQYEYTYYTGPSVKGYPVPVNSYTRTFTKLRDIAENAFSEGVEGMTMQLNDEFWIDGPCLERALNYNVGQIRELGGEWKETAIPSIWKKIQQQQASFQSWMDGIRMPSGKCPPIGNTSFSGIDTTKVQTVSGSCVYPFGGYAALRDGSGPDARYMFLNCNQKSRGHEYNGSNVIFVHAFGSMLLTSGGAAPYGSNPVENAIKGQAVGEGSSFKVNTWLVDNLNRSATLNTQVSPPSFGTITKCSSVPLRMRFQTTRVFDVVEHSIDIRFGHDPGFAYPGSFGSMQTPTKSTATITHQRIIIFVKPENAWIVVDRLTPQDTKVHEYRHPWILDASFKTGDVNLASNGFVTSRKTGPNVSVAHARDVLVNMYYGQETSGTPVASNAKSPVPGTNFGPAGWSAPGIGTVNPCVHVHSVFSAAGPVTMVTTIRAIAPDVASPPTLTTTIVTTDTGLQCAYMALTLNMKWVPGPDDGIYDSTTKLTVDIPLVKNVYRGDSTLTPSTSPAPTTRAPTLTPIPTLAPTEAATLSPSPTTPPIPPPTYLQFPPNLIVLVHEGEWMQKGMLKVMTLRNSTPSIENFVYKDLTQVFAIDANGSVRTITGQGEYVNHETNCDGVIGGTSATRWRFVPRNAPRSYALEVVCASNLNLGTKRIEYNSIINQRALYLSSKGGEETGWFVVPVARIG